VKKYKEKRTKKEVWLAMDRQTREIIGVFVGDRTRESAKQLWKVSYLSTMCRY
jgi:IS1 family transposase